MMRPACTIVLILAVLVPGAAFAQDPARVPCRHDDKECAAQALKGHAITKLDYWRSALARPLEQRIESASPEMVEFLALDNIQSGFPDKPRAAKLRREFLRDLRAAITELPPGVRRIASGKLAGVHLVRNLGGTGFTDTIYDANSNAVAGFIVLDVSVLEKRANAWATWKENTPFTPQSGSRLTALIETRRENSRKNAIQYILLHELGHVASINERIHPSWNVEPKEVASPGDYPYFGLSWSVSQADNRYVTRFDEAFPRRKDVVYYRQPKLPAGEMVSVYETLARTNFATLYAVTNPFDDFAEAFASYVHTVLMKKPFEIRIYRDGKLAKVYRSCWTEERCVEKKAIIEALLDGR